MINFILLRYFLGISGNSKFLQIPTRILNSYNSIRYLTTTNFNHHGFLTLLLSFTNDEHLKLASSQSALM